MKDRRKISKMQIARINNGAVALSTFSVILSASEGSHMLK